MLPIQGKKSAHFTTAEGEKGPGISLVCAISGALLSIVVHPFLMPIPLLSPFYEVGNKEFTMRNK